jgi:hypothetical protein
MYHRMPENRSYSCLILLKLPIAFSFTLSSHTMKVVYLCALHALFFSTLNVLEEGGQGVILLRSVTDVQS